MAFSWQAFDDDVFDVLGAPPPDIVINEFLINAVDRTNRIRSVRNVDLSYTLGSRGVLRCEALDKGRTTATAYRPALDELVEWSRNGFALFYGLAVGVEDRVLGEPNIGVVTGIEAVDYAAAVERRVVTSEAYEVGGFWTLRDIVDDLVTTYLSVFGITRDVSMGAGPTVAVNVYFDQVTVASALNYLSDVTGWIWRITPGKVLEMFAPGTKTALYSLTSTNSKIIGGPKWKKTRGKYVNRVIVRYGGNAQREITETFVAPGGVAEFFLSYPVVPNQDGFVAQLIRVTIGVTLNLQTLGGLWLYDPIAHSITALTTPAVGTLIEVIHAVPYPLYVTAEDAGEIAARGPWEEQVDAPDILHTTQAQYFADGQLRKYKANPRTLTIRTFEGMEFPGTTITVTAPERTLSGSWLITETRVRDLSRDILEYEFTCLEGSEAQGTWVDYLRSAFGGGLHSASVGSGTISGSFAPSEQGGVFTTEVIANQMETGLEVRLGEQLDSQGAGPGIMFDRGKDIEVNTWSMFARRPSFGAAGLHITCDQDRTQGAVARIIRHASGRYYVLPISHVPGSTGLFLGDPLGLSGLTSAARTIAGIGTHLLYAADGVYERGRTVRMGDFAPVTFSAGNFTASTGTWTVTSGQQLGLHYAKSGNSRTLSFAIVGGTLSATTVNVQITIPDGEVAGARMDNACIYVDSAGSGLAFATVVAAGTTVVIQRPAGSLAAGSLNVLGELRFQV